MTRNAKGVGWGSERSWNPGRHIKESGTRRLWHDQGAATNVNPKKGALNCVLLC